MINFVSDSDSSNLPAFNSNLSQSDAIVTVLPLTHGEHSNLALHSKILLALFNSLLDCDQLRALRLTRNEASKFVSLLHQACVEDPYHLAQDYTLLTLLRALIWFTHEYSSQDKTLISNYEKKLKSVSDDLKSNPQLLIEAGILSALKPVLKLKGQEDLQATAVRLLWSLAHDASVKKQILKDSDSLETIQDIYTCSSPKLNMVSHCTLCILGLQTKGMRNVLSHTCSLQFMASRPCSYLENRTFAYN